MNRKSVKAKPARASAAASAAAAKRRLRRRPEMEPYRSPLRDEPRRAVLNRLKSARGHLDAVLSRIEDENPYILDVLQQIAAVRGALDATARVVLRAYFEQVFVSAVQEGASDAASAELIEALAFLRAIE